MQPVALLSKHTLKNYLIGGIVGSLVVGALIGIYGVLFASFENVTLRILATTLAIGITSLTGLANTRHLESPHKPLRTFAWASIACSVIALVLVMVLTWIELDQGPFEATGIFAILAFSTAHISLLLPTKPRPAWLKTIIATTIVCIVGVASTLCLLIASAAFVDWAGEGFYRFLGVLAILDVLGTIVVPILSRLVPASSTEATPAIAPSNDNPPPPLPPTSSS